MISNVWSGDRPVTQPYGCTDLTVEPFWAHCLSKHFHCGIDVGMPVGTPLFAARSGTVAKISFGLLGITVGDQTDWYVHIDSAAVARGHLVTAGDLIAHSGAKIPAGGSLTGPHLHFEVQAGRLNFPATSIDPEPILQGEFVSGAGSLTGVNDLTKEEHDALMLLVKEIGAPLTPGGVASLLIGKENSELTKLDAILDAIAKIQSPPPAAVDLSPVLSAIADLRAEVEAIKAKTDKQLA
jgi:hypothetical protein